MPADLDTLPPTHRYEDTSMPLTTDATTTSGGTILAIRSTLYDKATRRHTQTHMRGRALTVSVYIGQWLHFCAVHVDSSHTMLKRQKMLQDIANYHKDRAGGSFLLGDWNLIHTDETRLLSSGMKVCSDAHLAKFFEDTFLGFLELRQPEHTFRRLARSAGASSTFSRIDKIYTSDHPCTLAPYLVQAWVKGDLSTRTSPSHHRAVEVDIRPRQRPPPPRLKTCVTAHHSFPAVVADEMNVFNQRREHGCQIRRDHPCSARCSAQGSADHPTCSGPHPTHSRGPLPQSSDLPPFGTHYPCRPDHP